MTIQNIAKQDLVDITQILIDPNLPLEQQKLEFVRQLKNPEVFLWNGITIHAKYNPKGPTLEECLQSMMG